MSVRSLNRGCYRYPAVRVLRVPCRADSSEWRYAVRGRVSMPESCRVERRRSPLARPSERASVVAPANRNADGRPGFCLNGNVGLAGAC